MPNERAQSIPLSDQQKRLFPEIYGGLSEKKPELASELNQAEMTKLASLVKKENIEQKKQQEIADINERQQNTIWEQTTTDKNGNVSPLPTIENLQNKSQMNSMIFIRLCYRTRLPMICHARGCRLIFQRLRKNVNTIQCKILSAGTLGIENRERNV